MAKFEYEKVEPILPGCHIEGWKTIRKKQWKQVEYILKDVSSRRVERHEIKYAKEHLFFTIDAELPDFDYSILEEPLYVFFLEPNQSQEFWDEYWEDFFCDCTFDCYELMRKDFFNSSHIVTPKIKEPFGAFGGLEQRLLPYFVRNNVYTDELVKFGRCEHRKIPWESPERVHNAIIRRNGEFTESELVSPFTPYQWLHEMFVSTFQYDIEYEEISDFACMQDYLPSLEDNSEEKYHINHLKSARLMIEIFEDEGTPKYLRDLWRKVKDSSVKSSHVVRADVESDFGSEEEGIESNGIIVLAEFADEARRDVAYKYLDEETRPEFGEDIPESDISVFEAVNETDYPIQLKEIEDNKLIWVIDGCDPNYEPMADPIALGASRALMASVQLEGEPSISVKEFYNGINTSLFEMVEYDDLDRDKPIQAFNQKLLNKLEEKGEVDFIQWLDNSLREDFNIPEWNFGD